MSDDQKDLVVQSSPQEEIDVVGISSTLFGLYHPQFEKLVDSLSTNGVRRLLKALVAYPLEERYIKGSSENEKAAFQIGRRLLEANFLLTMDTYVNNAEELLAVANSETKEEKEEKNGE